MMSLPKDPVLLLSVVNTQLRDHYSSLDLLCEDHNVDAQSILDSLAAIDYSYDPNQNQFI